MLKKMVHGVGSILKPFVNVKAWANWQDLKENNQKLARLAKSVLSSEKVDQFTPETFQEAIIRLKLDEAALLKREKTFKRLAFIYSFVAFLVVIYAIYLIVYLNFFMAFLMSLVVLWIVLALAFRQHFWYVQMKERRLGLSFLEWFQITFRSK